MFSRRTKVKAVGKAARGAGKAAKSRPGRGLARGAGKVALKGGKGSAKVAGRALSSGESGRSRYLKYGFFALAGFAVGALVARAGEREVSGLDVPDPDDLAARRGETWGAGTLAGGVSDPARPLDPQLPEEPNRTGAEREYSDPSAGPLIGQSHRGGLHDIPVQEEEVENRIRTRVGEDPRTLDLPRLNVEVNEGVADIRGEVHTEEEKQAVEEIASDTEGVTEVRNLLTVNPDAPSRRGKSAEGHTDS